MQSIECRVLQKRHDVSYFLFFVSWLLSKGVRRHKNQIDPMLCCLEVPVLWCQLRLHKYKVTYQKSAFTCFRFLLLSEVLFHSQDYGGCLPFENKIEIAFNINNNKVVFHLNFCLTNYYTESQLPRLSRTKLRLSFI